MYKKIIYFSTIKDLQRLFLVNKYAQTYKLKLIVCSTVVEFLNNYTCECFIVYNSGDRESVEKIDKLFSFANVQFVAENNLNNFKILQTKTHKTITKNQASQFFDHINMFSNEPAVVVLKKMFINCINYGGKFNYNILKITCMQWGLKEKQELFSLRSYIKQWHKLNDNIISTFLFYNYKKITIKNFILGAIKHYLSMEFNGDYIFHSCEYYLKTICGERIYKTNNKFLDDFFQKQKIKL